MGNASSVSVSGSGSGSGSVSACDSDSNSGSGGEKYKVFLSFRGPDTRKTFTDFLYLDLYEKNIRTFRDKEELPVGEEIRPEILKAIDESKIYIPILTKDYASSKSCLLELAHMVGCHKTGGKKIIPVFYDVEPSDVEHQRGSYKKAFRQHQKTRDQKTIQDWKDALKVVAQLKGHSKKDTDGHEGALTKRIVKEVLVELKNCMDVPELVGMDHHVDKMRGLLNVDSNGVRVVGIYGMGGLGKTTIAKFIYDQLCENFKCCCFLEDIRETSQQKGLAYLQSQLLSRILQGEGRVIDNVDNGIKEIRNAVNGKKVLIVLDDVDEKSQFDKLVKNCDWFGSGSRIIITTRDQGVLNGLCKKEGQLQVYQPEFMKPDHSLLVFSKHAFDSLSPPKDYDTLSKEVVSYAAGLPLVLVVTGSLLRGEDKQFWEDILKKLKNIPAGDVQKKLRISFDPLDKEQKEIFLDIACLFVGEDKTNLFYMWDDCGFYPESGINVLVLRSLIKVGDDNRIWMHDQVRELGRRIVDEENLTDKGERSRLWRPEEALSILERHTGTNKVVALCLDLKLEQMTVWEPPRCLLGKAFKELRNLRYLRLRRADFAGDFKDRFLNLRWLQYSDFHEEFKLTNLGLKNLVVLQLSSGNITDEWEGWNEIKMATKLKVLDVSGCVKLTEIRGLGELKSLQSLILGGCRSIETLPDLSSLENLRDIYVSGCVELTEIRGLGELKSLQSLILRVCWSIETLPDLSSLENLRDIYVFACVELTEIRDLGELKSLQSLILRGCLSIETLPDLSSLENLRDIDVSDCVKLTEIRGLGELKSLQSLILRGCRSIETLPDLSSLENLRDIDVSGCVKLTEIRGLGELKSLQSLILRGCGSIETLPDLSSLENLRDIDVSACVKLTEIRGLGELKSLQSLILRECESIETLPDLSSLENLRDIDVSYCVKLTEIRGLGELKSLQFEHYPICQALNI